MEEGAGDRKGVIGGKLSQSKLQERSRKGLCFKYGEKWGADHICKLKHYQLVLMESGEREEEEVLEEPGEEELELEAKTLQLSFNSYKGLTSNKSFKVWGKI